DRLSAFATLVIIVSVAVNIVMLHWAMRRFVAMHAIVGMHVFTAIVPMPLPRMIVNDHSMLRPIHGRTAPPPRRESRAERHGTESNRSSGDKSRTRAHEHDAGAVNRHWHHI